jgi:hypothetical protein
MLTEEHNIGQKNAYFVEIQSTTVLCNKYLNYQVTNHTVMRTALVLSWTACYFSTQGL